MDFVFVACRLCVVSNPPSPPVLPFPFTFRLASDSTASRNIAAASFDSSRSQCALIIAVHARRVGSHPKTTTPSAPTSQEVGVFVLVLVSPPLVDPIRHVITDPIYPYPYRVVITTLVAEQLDAYPDL